MGKGRLEVFSDGTQVSGSVPWADPHLLFWPSLLPFANGWMGENHVAAVPSALDGGVLLRAAIASWVLQRALIAAKGARSVLGAAVGGDRKGRLSPVLPAAHRFHAPDRTAGAGPVRAGNAARARSGPAHRACAAAPSRLTRAGRGANGTAVAWDRRSRPTPEKAHADP